MVRRVGSGTPYRQKGWQWNTLSVEGLAVEHPIVGRVGSGTPYRQKGLQWNPYRQKGSPEAAVVNVARPLLSVRVRNTGSCRTTHLPARFAREKINRIVRW